MAKLFLLWVLVIFLTACEDKSAPPKNMKILTVKAHSVVTSLFYAGVVQPLKTVVVTSPAEGVVEDIRFRYGQKVASSQLLFSVASEKFQADLKKSLLLYITAKTEYSSTQNQFQEAEFLHKNQLISDDALKEKHNSFYNAKLALFQAKDALETMLMKSDNQSINFYKLKIEDFDKIAEVLRVRDNLKSLKVYSPIAGLILLPGKSDHPDADTKKISKWDQVKQGDVLALIGDESGFVVQVNVDEFNINKIKLGQKVKVTSLVFPDVDLVGSITGIDYQAQNNQAGVPDFAIEITIPKLTPNQQSLIHVGMSVKAEIDIESPPQISIPLAAVKEKEGNVFVTVVKSPGHTEEKQVKTGQITNDEIVILSNLKAGDKIVVSS